MTNVGSSVRVHERNGSDGAEKRMLSSFVTGGRRTFVVFVTAFLATAICILLLDTFKVPPS